MGFIGTFRGERRPAGSPRRKGFRGSYPDQQPGAGAWGSPLPAVWGGKTSKLPTRTNPRWSPHTPEGNRLWVSTPPSEKERPDPLFAKVCGDDFRPHPRWPPAAARAGGASAVGRKVTERQQNLLSPSSDPTRTGRSASSWSFAASALLCPRSSGEEVPSGWEEKGLYELTARVRGR